MNQTTATIHSVSEITKDLKRLLEDNYRFVHVGGEVSNLATPYSGHSYFTLKDSGAQLRAVLFKQQKRFVSEKLANGMEVICFGRISIYEPRGEYQLIVDSVENYGQGRLQLLFDRLRLKLADQGYFDGAKKKPIPEFTRQIAVISSPTGAAIRDFIKTIRTLSNGLILHLFPVRVQGLEAARQISEALTRADRLGDYDCIVLCRGGGSLEDLWAFNEEQVADAIFSAKTPILTGIGHETDTTIADFCADLRCPTPTAAATIIAANRSNLQTRLAQQNQRLQTVIVQRHSQAQKRLADQLRFLSAGRHFYRDSSHRLQMGAAYLQAAMRQQLVKKQARFDQGQQRLISLAPEHKIKIQQYKLEISQTALRKTILAALDLRYKKLQAVAARLHGVSPLATLARGYSVARRLSPGQAGKQIITATDDVLVGETINVLLHKGELLCQVNGKKEEKAGD